MEEDDTEFDELIKKALDNALMDRDRASEAFEKTKGIYEVNLDDKEDSSSLQGLMLIGQNVSKLLEINLKCNDQIINLAKLKKAKNPGKTDDKSTGPISSEDVERVYEMLKSEKFQ